MQARYIGRAALRPWWLAMLLAVLMPLMVGCSDSPAPAPTISVQPSDTSAVAGSAATLSITATGPDITYQWQVSTDGGATWTNVAGATQTGYTTPPTTLADSGKRFRVVVSSAGISVNSSIVQLTVTPAVVAPALTVQPAAQTSTAPDPATFSVTASGTSPTYQWQRSTDGGTSFVNIAGATAVSYSTGATSTTMDSERYRVVVTNSAGSVTSSAVVLTVNPTPVAAVFTTQPANQSVTAGSAAAFSIAVTGTPPPTLQWQRSTDGGATFANVPGATDSTFNTGLTNISQSGERYRAIASNSAGNAISNAATLTVSPASQAPAITTQPTAQTVTAQASATFTAAATGVPTPSWQWQVSSDNAVSFANINGATSASYTTPATTPADSGKFFRAIATSASGSINTNAVLLTVNAAPGMALFAGDFTAGGGGNGADGTGTQARFDFPEGLVADAGGNLYVAQSNVDRVARINPGGVVTTIYDATLDGRVPGSFNVSNVALGPNGDLYAAATSYCSVYRIGMPASATRQLTIMNPDGCSGSTVRGLAVDSQGRPYLSLTDSNTIFRVANAAVGGVYPTSAFVGPANPYLPGSYFDASGSAARFHAPRGMAFATNGDLFVADSENHVIRRVTPQGDVTTFAGTAGQADSVDGTGPAARFNTPAALAFDGVGNLYVLDLGASPPAVGTVRVRRISPGSEVSTLFNATAEVQALATPAQAGFAANIRGLAVLGTNRIALTAGNAIVVRTLP